MMYEKNITGIFDTLERIRRLDGETFTPIQDLNSEELTKFRAINSKMMKYEKSLTKEIKTQFRLLKRRIEDEDDFITDFTCKIEMCFYVDTKDFVYKEDSDNIMMIMTMYVSRKEWSWGFDDGNCHNTIPNRQSSLVENDIHCASFHALYDHTDLSYKEITKIGSFDINIKVELEHCDIVF